MSRGDPECLSIREVAHEAFVSVDKAGTEGTAATGVVMQAESAKPTPISVTVDRPFIFITRDRRTGAVLFVGRVEEPCCGRLSGHTHALLQIVGSSILY